jgi:hypothetical protein
MENTSDKIIFYLPSSIWLRYGLIKFKPYIFFPNIKMQENKLTNVYLNEHYFKNIFIL